ncbi:MAG: elongation factor [Patescibacteria group bacterium]|nr:elongation factor [Patescibacteria group bacterium]
MSVLDYSEIKPRKVILHDDEPYEILESHVARTQKRKPQNQVKMRNLINGKVIPFTFHASDTADEAEVSRKQSKFLYASKGEFWFCDPKNPSNRYLIDADLIADNHKWLLPNLEVTCKVFGEDEEERIISIELPIKMTFTVKEAPPAIKGNTASGGDKLVTLETGASVTTPLFIETGDKVVINTETGTYVERA